MAIDDGVDAAVEDGSAVEDVLDVSRNVLGSLLRYRVSKIRILDNLGNKSY